MRYRDHINTAALIFSGLYFLYLQVSEFGNAILRMLFPFLDMVRAHSAQPLFLTTAAIAFFFGASFPDIDVAFYAKGHRSRSPLHNLSIAGALYALSVLLCLWLKDGLLNLQIASLSFNLFMFGWICHLCGDMIQGGCGYIPGRSKKIGFTKFTWDVYDGTFAGKLFTLALWCMAVAVLVCVIKIGSVTYGAEQESLLAAGGIWTAALCLYSYNKALPLLFTLYILSLKQLIHPFF